MRFKFFNPTGNSTFWADFVKGPHPERTVIYHNDPFFAECRAYGRIAEFPKKGKSREVAIPCRGYILLNDKDQKFLEEKGIDLDTVCLDDELITRYGNPPVRAIVKDLASRDPGITRRSAFAVLKRIRAMNRTMKIYNRDIRKDNFRDGLLVDFGSSWTEPHCYCVEENSLDRDHTKGADLMNFDDMMEREEIKTHHRGLADSQFRMKLRSWGK